MRRGLKFLDARSMDGSTLAEACKTLSHFPFDPFRNYPASSETCWRSYLERRLVDYARNPSTHVVVAVRGGESVGLVGYRESAWDTEHFGFPVAQIDHLIAVDEDFSQRAEVQSRFLEDFEAWSARASIRFVTCRCDGDNLAAIHCLEARRFQFIEHNLCPLIDLRELDLSEPDPAVRSFDESDLERIREIASAEQYARGRFYADPRFDEQAAWRIQARVVDSCIESGYDITVLEIDGRVQAFFLHRYDEELSKALGCRLGRWRLAAVASEARGRQLGHALFLGTLRRMRQTCDYVDSGLATKNTHSANLHWKLGFKVAYESVTLHRWFE